MFEDEVDYAVGDSDDWSPSVVFDSDDRMIRWMATAKRSGGGTGDAAVTTGKFFKTLWFDDNLNGKIKKDSSADRSATGATDVDALHDLYNQNEDEGNLEWIWGVPDRRRRRPERRRPRQGRHGERRGRRGHRR